MKKYWPLIIFIFVIGIVVLFLYTPLGKKFSDEMSGVKRNSNQSTFQSYTHPTGLFSFKFPTDWEVQSNEPPIEQLKESGAKSVPVFAKLKPAKLSYGEAYGESLGEQELLFTILIGTKGDFLTDVVDRKLTREYLTAGYPSFKIYSYYTREKSKLNSAEYVTRNPISPSEEKNHDLIQTTYYTQLTNPFGIDKRAAYVYLVAYTGEENQDFRKKVDEVIGSIEINADRLPYVVQTLFEQLEQ